MVLESAFAVSEERTNLSTPSILIVSSLFHSFVLKTITSKPNTFPNLTTMWPKPPNPTTPTSCQVGSFCGASWVCKLEGSLAAHASNPCNRQIENLIIHIFS
jgi:hypothetical protein